MNPKKFARFGHDRKSGVDLNFPFCGFHFYHWTPRQVKHKGWLYFYRFWWISYKWMSCLSVGDVQDVHKSRPEFGRCLSVEDTWPPTMRVHILLMENPEKEGNLILGMSQRCYGKFKFLDSNSNFKDNSCLINKMGPNISLRLQTEFHYN